MKCYSCHQEVSKTNLKYINGNYGYCSICLNRSNNAAKIYKANKQVKKDYVLKYKMNKGCSICGYNKCGDALHLHHNNPDDKTGALSRMIQQEYSVDRLQQEMDKCTVMCANCHAEQHYAERTGLD